jgi:hypothetical protein
MPANKEKEQLLSHAFLLKKVYYDPKSRRTAEAR